MDWLSCKDAKDTGIPKNILDNKLTKLKWGLMKSKEIKIQWNERFILGHVE